MGASDQMRGIRRRSVGRQIEGTRQRITNIINNDLWGVIDQDTQFLTDRENKVIVDVREHLKKLNDHLGKLVVRLEK